MAILEYRRMINNTILKNGKNRLHQTVRRIARQQWTINPLGQMLDASRCHVIDFAIKQI